MDISSFSLVRVSNNYSIKPFDCGDNDLNDFLLNNCVGQFIHLLNVSYFLEDEVNNKTVGFYSLLNDKISLSESKSKSFWNKHVSKQIPYLKRRPSYPAMKIGRLGIDKGYQNKGLGTKILDYLKILFITNNRTGCRFITVDAYHKSLNFYLKNGFNYLTDKDEDEDTRLMYYDLAFISE
jgi:GNAT superfamily N-acetyltransferase